MHFDPKDLAEKFSHTVGGAVENAVSPLNTLFQGFSKLDKHDKYSLVVNGLIGDLNTIWTVEGIQKITKGQGSWIGNAFTAINATVAADAVYKIGKTLFKGYGNTPKP